METSLSGVQNFLLLPSSHFSVPIHGVVGCHGDAPPRGGLLHSHVGVQVVIELLVRHTRLRHHVGGIVVVLLSCFSLGKTPDVKLHLLATSYKFVMHK